MTGISLLEISPRNCQTVKPSKTAAPLRSSNKLPWGAALVVVCDCWLTLQFCLTRRIQSTRLVLLSNLLSSKEKMKDILNEAKALAAFSNLKDDEVEYFRKNYSDFMPDIWSTVSIGADSAQHMLQGLLADAWRSGFTLDDCVGLITAVARFSRLEKSLQHYMQAYDGTATGPLPPPETWPIQRAVMFLGMNPWRASICSRCGKRYVKDKSTRRFCSDKCFQESRLLSKRSWWSEHAKEKRTKRKKG